MNNLTDDYYDFFFGPRCPIFGGQLRFITLGIAGLAASETISCDKCGESETAILPSQIGIPTDLLDADGNFIGWTGDGVHIRGCEGPTRR